MGSTRNKKMNAVIRGEEPQRDRGPGNEGLEDLKLEEMETEALWELDAAISEELQRRSASRSATADVRRQTKEIREVEA